MTQPRHTLPVGLTLSLALSFTLSLALSLTLSALVSGLISRPAHASCLLSFEEAAPLTQGDVIAQLGGFGGHEGAGGVLSGRLGLPQARELHLRVGACERSLTDRLITERPTGALPSLTVWAYGLEVGMKQRLVSHQDTQLVDLSLSMSAVLLSASDDRERGAEQQALGVTPTLMISYPLPLSEDRGAFVNLSLGASALFMDHNQEPSRFDFTPLMSLGGGAELLPTLSARAELRWHLGGAYGGLAFSYKL